MLHVVSLVRFTYFAIAHKRPVWFFTFIMNNYHLREQHQRQLERGLTLQVTPKLEASGIWRRVWLAARLEGRTVTELVADGIMTAVEAAEDALGDKHEFKIN